MYTFGKWKFTPQEKHQVAVSGYDMSFTVNSFNDLIVGLLITNPGPNPIFVGPAKIAQAFHCSSSTVAYWFRHNYIGGTVRVIDSSDRVGRYIIPLAVLPLIVPPPYGERVGAADMSMIEIPEVPPRPVRYTEALGLGEWVFTPQNDKVVVSGEQEFVLTLEMFNDLIVGLLYSNPGPNPEFWAGGMAAETFSTGKHGDSIHQATASRWMQQGYIPGAVMLVASTGTRSTFVAPAAALAYTQEPLKGNPNLVLRKQSLKV